MYIEYFGLPASGKSTVSTQVIRRLRAKGIPSLFASGYADEAHEKSTLPAYVSRDLVKLTLYRATVFRLENLELMQNLERMDSGDPTHLYLYHNMASQYQAYVARPLLEGVVSQDEGFFHRGEDIIRRVYRGEEGIQKFNEYIGLLPDIDFVVFLDMPPDASYERTKARIQARPRYQNLSDEKIEAIIDNHYGRREMFLQRAKAHQAAIKVRADSGKPYIVVDSMGNLRANADAITNALVKTLKSK